MDNYRTFISKHKSSGLKITFKYSFNGVLKLFEVEGEWSDIQVSKILPRIPVSVGMMLADIKAQRPASPWNFTEVSDISFEAFYQKYPKKVGRKEDTVKAWNKLNATDQMEAILYIPELIKLKADGTAFPYPATYLNKKLWR